MAVAIEIVMLTTILIKLTALAPADISFPLRTRNRLPIKVDTSSFGEMMAVASAYDRGWTVGKVDMAPLHNE